MITGILQDLVDGGYLIDEDKTFLTCDSKKIFRAKKNMMTSSKVAEKMRVLKEDFQGIFFVGCDDKTKVVTQNEETG